MDEPTPGTRRIARRMVRYIEVQNNVEFGCFSWKIVMEAMRQIDTTWDNKICDLEEEIAELRRQLDSDKPDYHE